MLEYALKQERWVGGERGRVVVGGDRRGARHCGRDRSVGGDDRVVVVK